MRSRAVSLPALCSRSRRSGPPPASASSEMRRSSSMRSRCWASEIKLGLVSDNGSSLGRGFLWGKNAHGKMRGEPDGSEQQYDAEEQLRAHGGGALERRLERSHVLRGPDKNEHRSNGHRHDEHGGKSGRGLAPNKPLRAAFDSGGCSTSSTICPSAMRPIWFRCRRRLRSSSSGFAAGRKKA